MASAVFFLLLAAISASTADDPSGPIGYKSTRGGSRGLYPFPRTGRSGVPHPHEFQEFADNKRSNLFPFPRVGRSDPYLRYSPDLIYLGPVPANFERGLSAIAGGLWLRPAFGHPLKRTIEEYDEYAAQSEGYPSDVPINDEHKPDRQI